MKQPIDPRLVTMTALASVAVTAAVLGCLESKANGSTVGNAQQSSTRYTSLDELQPATVPYTNAYIIFGGSPVETTLEPKTSDGKVVFTFVANGSVIDEERYAYDATTFRFLGDVSQSFEPGVPLLRVPFNVGEGWTWAGTYKLGPEGREASAKVSTADERLNTVAGEFDTVRVNVVLQVETVSAKPVERKLVFWIAPKKGVVRHEFQDSTTREPMPSQAKDQTP